MEPAVEAAATAAMPILLPASTASSAIPCDTSTVAAFITANGLTVPALALLADVPARELATWLMLGGGAVELGWTEALVKEAAVIGARVAAQVQAAVDRQSTSAHAPGKGASSSSSSSSRAELAREMYGTAMRQTGHAIRWIQIPAAAVPAALLEQLCAGLYTGLEPTPPAMRAVWAAAAAARAPGQGQGQGEGQGQQKQQQQQVFAPPSTLDQAALASSLLPGYLPVPCTMPHHLAVERQCERAREVRARVKRVLQEHTAMAWEYKQGTWRGATPPFSLLQAGQGSAGAWEICCLDAWGQVQWSKGGREGGASGSGSGGSGERVWTRWVVEEASQDGGEEEDEEEQEEAVAVATLNRLYHAACAVHYSHAVHAPMPLGPAHAAPPVQGGGAGGSGQGQGGQPHSSGTSRAVLVTALAEDMHAESMRTGVWLGPGGVGCSPSATLPPPSWSSIRGWEQGGGGAPTECAREVRRILAAALVSTATLLANRSHDSGGTGLWLVHVPPASPAQQQQQGPGSLPAPGLLQDRTIAGAVAVASLPPSLSASRASSKGGGAGVSRGSSSRRAGAGVQSGTQHAATGAPTGRAMPLQQSNLTYIAGQAGSGAAEERTYPQGSLQEWAGILQEGAAPAWLALRQAALGRCLPIPKPVPAGTTSPDSTIDLMPSFTSSSQAGPGTLMHFTTAIQRATCMAVELTCATVAASTVQGGCTGGRGEAVRAALQCAVYHPVPLGTPPPPPTGGGGGTGMAREQGAAAALTSALPALLQPLLLPWLLQTFESLEALLVQAQALCCIEGRRVVVDTCTAMLEQVRQGMSAVAEAASAAAMDHAQAEHRRAEAAGRLSAPDALSLAQAASGIHALPTTTSPSPSPSLVQQQEEETELLQEALRQKRQHSERQHASTTTTSTATSAQPGRAPPADALRALLLPSTGTTAAGVGAVQAHRALPFLSLPALAAVLAEEAGAAQSQPGQGGGGVSSWGTGSTSGSGSGAPVLPLPVHVATIQACLRTVQACLWALSHATGVEAGQGGTPHPAHETGCVPVPGWVQQLRLVLCCGYTLLHKAPIPIPMPTA